MLEIASKVGSKGRLLLSMLAVTSTPKLGVEPASVRELNEDLKDEEIVEAPANSNPKLCTLNHLLPRAQHNCSHAVAVLPQKLF